LADIIRLLPDSLANQIAAGEVVQRPASVVKELMENAIDADATSIQLIVKDAGKILIQVIDNGSGMSENDARMCFERHATSKISKTDDLFAIKTMGFRGEAMASIAAVAQVELRTQRRDDDLGVLLRIEGSETKEVSPISVEPGTSISVKNLFYNVPARRNFLKSTQLELSHIIEEFTRVALAFPEVQFSMYNNDNEVYNLPAGKLSQRIVNLFGNAYKEQLITLEEETNYLKVWGYVGKPENAKKKRGEQYFFANNRYIKHNYLHHAVMESFKGLLPDDSYPFYVIFMEIDPSKIDINVHPTKTEIKFEDERSIYGIMLAATKKALGTHNIVPSIDFGLDVNFDPFRSMDSSPNSNGGKFQSTYRAPSNSNVQNWNKLYEGNEENTFQSRISNFENESLERGVVDDELTFESSMNSSSNPPQNTFNKDILLDSVSSTFQLHGSYIITQVKSGMMIIDQQAAHERILYEKFLSNMEKHHAASQQFLFPQTLELSPSDYAILMEIEEEVRALGFSYNIFSNNAIVINGIPADVNSGNEKALFEGLIEQFKQNKSELKLNNKDNLARALAKRTCIKQGTKLGSTEMNSLIDQLFACKNPNYTPSGGVTLVIWGLDKVAQIFRA
jgi:DNA mismatch repair protein MutL